MNNNQKVLIVVDDSNTNLLASKNILRPYYTVYTVPSVEKLFGLLKNITPDLILLDIEMPGIDGYEAARRLKSSEAYGGIPIIFLSARNDATSEMEGFKLGALDFFHKPFSSAVLLSRIENHLSLINFRKTSGAKDSYIEKLLLYMSQIDAENFKASCCRFDLEKPLNNVVDAIKAGAKEKNRNVSICLKNGVQASIVSDEVIFSLVLFKLLFYALEIMPENGELILTVEKETESEDEITLDFGIVCKGAGAFKEPQKQFLLSLEHVKHIDGKIKINDELDKDVSFVLTIKAKKGDRR